MVCSSILERPEPVIGFCFSFPVDQASVNSGKLLRWTKGYTNPGAVGQDPARLLAEAFRRKVPANGAIGWTAHMAQGTGTCCLDGSCNTSHPICTTFMSLSMHWWESSECEEV